MLNLRFSDYEKLLYIHSNHNIIPTNFKEKFFKTKTLRRAFQLLKFYEARGYLKSYHKNLLKPTIFSLTDKALKELYDKGLLLAWNLRFPHIALNKQEHNDSVTALRIAIEASSDFSDVFYLSDYEINQGITREAKWKFYHELDVEGRKEFLSRWKPKPKKKGDRRPDGYFEALVDREVKSFVLEYERMPYGNRRIFSVVDKLEDCFRESTKIIICKEPERAAKLKESIQAVMKYVKRGRGFKTPWLIGDLPTTLKNPFLKTLKPIQRP